MHVSTSHLTMVLYLMSRTQLLQKPAKYVYFYNHWNARLLQQSNSTIRQSHNTTDEKTKVSKWMKYRGFLAIVAPVGLCYFAVMQWKHYRRNVYGTRPASEWQLRCYCALPLRFLSRCWGWIAEKQIPEPFRPFVYGLYTSTFGVNLSEAKVADFKHYRTLSDFFVRELRHDARQIDAGSVLVSPCDGTVLHHGLTDCGLIEQVKGMTYSLDKFLGDSECVNNKAACTELYQCVIYLAPGDYHRFHSPADWEPTERRHFTGQLLSVNPRIASWIPGLFTLNERASYIGKWVYGFFSFTAVGATNVGNIKVYCDNTLQTNQHINTPCQRKCDISKVELIKGDPFGEFRMGSTIVLIFEAPINFEFSVSIGEKIQMGKSIGCIRNNKYTDRIAEKSVNIQLRER